MKHLVIGEYGTSLGVTEERLVVKEKGTLIAEYPLSRIHTVTIAKEGVSLSSNFVLESAVRGIRIFFLNGLGECTACLSGIRSHGVGLTRKNQILFLEDSHAASELAMRVTYGKIRNQRAVLCYFAKSENARKSGMYDTLSAAANQLKTCADHAFSSSQIHNDCRSSLLGIEGIAASAYWQSWVNTGILPEDFMRRGGRGSRDVTNSALNYGYAILMSRVWNAILTAGLEPYLSFYHVDRPGKPSLVLDLMEELRAWCVDRNVIKRRSLLISAGNLTPPIKKKIINDVQETFSHQYMYKGKKLSLDSILQRQIYRLAGHFAGRKIYKPYLFKW